MLDGKTYKYCAKCCHGKGYWTSGDSLHSTEEHDPTKFKKNQNKNKKDTENNNNEKGKKENNDSNSANMARVPENSCVPDFDTFDFGFDDANIAEVSNVSDSKNFENFDFGFDGNFAETSDFDITEFGYNNTVNIKELNGYCKPCIPALTAVPPNKPKDEVLKQTNVDFNEDWYQVKDQCGHA